MQPEQAKKDMILDQLPKTLIQHQNLISILVMKLSVEQSVSLLQVQLKL